MSFDEFKKDDLDFTSLIDDKPKKAPKPAEGLGFLNPNFKRRFTQKVQQTNTNKETAVPSTKTSIEDNRPNIKTSIEVNRPSINNSIEENIPSPKSSIDKVFSKTNFQNNPKTKNTTPLSQEPLINKQIDGSRSPKLVSESITAQKRSLPLHDEKISFNEKSENVSMEENVPSTKSSNEEKRDPKKGVNTSIEDTMPNTITSIEDSRPHNSISIEENRPSSISSIDNVKIKLDANYTTIPLSLIDSLHLFSKNEFLVYLFLFRQSYGWPKRENSTHISLTNISVSKSFIQTALGLTKSTIIKSINSLIKKDFIKENKSNVNLAPTFNVYYPNALNNNSLCNNEIKSSFFLLDNNIFETKFKGVDFLVYFFLSYYSYGENNICTSKILTGKDLSNKILISTRSIQESIRKLISFGYIERLNNDKSSSGIIYHVFLPHEVNSNLKTHTKVISLESSNTKSLSSIEVNRPGINSSIEAINKINLKSSIEENNLNKGKDANLNAPKIISTESSIEVNRHKETKKILKTSSSDADDFYIFLKTDFPDISFPLAKEKLQTYLSDFGIDLCKKHILRLKPRLAKAESPVGLWINSLKNPANYPELDQKTESEFFQEQREKEEEQRRAAQIEEKQKQDKIKRVNTSWNTLDEMQQEEFIAMSEKHFREKMEAVNLKDKLPPRAVIVEHAKTLNFEK
jgi:predicted transcriptional regulator